MSKKFRVFLDKKNNDSVLFFNTVKFYLECLNLGSENNEYIKVNENCIQIGRTDFKIFLIDTDDKNFEEKLMGMEFNFMVVSNSLLKYNIFRIFKNFSEKVMVV